VPERVCWWGPAGEEGRCTHCQPGQPAEDRAALAGQAPAPGHRLHGVRQGRPRCSAAVTLLLPATCQPPCAGQLRCHPAGGTSRQVCTQRLLVTHSRASRLLRWRCSAVPARLGRCSTCKRGQCGLGAAALGNLDVCWIGMACCQGSSQYTLASRSAMLTRSVPGSLTSAGHDTYKRSCQPSCRLHLNLEVELSRAIQYSRVGLRRAAAAMMSQAKPAVVAHHPSMLVAHGWPYEVDKDGALPGFHHRSYNLMCQPGRAICSQVWQQTRNMAGSSHGRA